MERIAELLNKLGIPFAYDHFAEGESPDPPFVCYRVPNTENFGADGVVYFGINVVDGNGKETGRSPDRIWNLL